MIRIKLFALFIAFALLALVRPRKCLELLEAADRGASRDSGPLTDDEIIVLWNSTWQADTARTAVRFARKCLARAQLAQECPLPPAGWRCTRRAGHDGPCAAVVK